jgi:hypothetical protein
VHEHVCLKERKKEKKKERKTFIGQLKNKKNKDMAMAILGLIIVKGDKHGAEQGLSLIR